MGTFSTNEFKNGMKLMIDNAPCTILECEFVKPGKGQAFARVKTRNLKTNRVVERTYKSGESLESADVIDMEMQYLYHDGDFFHFMDPESFEQYSANDDVVGDSKLYLKDQDLCTVTLWNGEPLQVTPPNFVILQVAETDPGLKGDTSGGGSKPATLETGAIVKVPLFVQIGELLKIDTRSNEYVSRAK
tara:strand:- start:517 stop:1083 length:567 start_codon:yes stop_codon:yes gene_type:complete